MCLIELLPSADCLLVAKSIAMDNCAVDSKHSNPLNGMKVQRTPKKKHCVRYRVRLHMVHARSRTQEKKSRKTGCPTFPPLQLLRVHAPFLFFVLYGVCCVYDVWVWCLGSVPRVVVCVRSCLCLCSFSTTNKIDQETNTCSLCCCFLVAYPRLKPFGWVRVCSNRT